MDRRAERFDQPQGRAFGGDVLKQAYDDMRRKHDQAIGFLANKLGWRSEEIVKLEKTIITMGAHSLIGVMWARGVNELQKATSSREQYLAMAKIVPVFMAAGRLVGLGIKAFRDMPAQVAQFADEADVNENNTIFLRSVEASARRLEIQAPDTKTDEWKTFMQDLYEHESEKFYEHESDKVQEHESDKVQEGDLILLGQISMGYKEVDSNTSAAYDRVMDSVLKNWQNRNKEKVE